MKHIGFKHQRENEQNSDKRHFIEINKLMASWDHYLFNGRREVIHTILLKIS
jgi:hypothetical protein